MTRQMLGTNVAMQSLKGQWRN